LNARGHLFCGVFFSFHAVFLNKVTNGLMIPCQGSIST
jgi:hypothetical protein